MKYTYNPEGVCSMQMIFDIEGDIIKSLKIIGGCPGNTVGVSRLVEGKKIDDVINLFKEGYNLGNCSEFAKLLSYAYDSSKIAIGYFKPSYNGQNGHAWMECGNYIYDTTLLLKIDKEYANVLGYVKLKEYDPMTNSLYRNRKQIYNEKYNVIKGK